MTTYCRQCAWHCTPMELWAWEVQGEIDDLPWSEAWELWLLHLQYPI